MKAQKIIFLAGVTAMFCACNTKPVGYFCVSGKISDADGREIYLYRTSNNRSAATVDTAVIENGRFRRHSGNSNRGDPYDGRPTEREEQNSCGAFCGTG